MRKRLQLFIGVALLLVLPTLGFAQAALTSTTLSAAVTSTSTQTIRVTSATGFAVGNLVYVDREAMRISAVSGTTISVIRGMNGTIAQPHNNGHTVYVGPQTYFTTHELFGACTSTNQVALPFINVMTGDQFQCYGSRWTRIQDQTFWVQEAVTTLQGISPSYKGLYANITVPSSVTGENQYFKAIQGQINVSSGANPAEVWGVYGIVNVTGTGDVLAPWPVVGELSVDGTGNFGDPQPNSFLTAGYFHSWINATKGRLGGIDAPLVGDINSATGRRKADAAIAGVLNGAISESVAGAGAAFKAYDFNQSANFDYGLDLYYNDGTYSNVFALKDIRLSSQATIGTGTALPAMNCTDGSIYLRTATGVASTVLYVCAPANTWGAVTVP